MPNPKLNHPYTDKPNHHYLTVVFEQVGDEKGDTSAIFDSLRESTPCHTLPDYRVTAVSIGDTISEQEKEEEQDNE